MVFATVFEMKQKELVFYNFYIKLQVIVYAYRKDLSILDTLPKIFRSRT